MAVLFLKYYLVSWIRKLSRLTVWCVDCMSGAYTIVCLPGKFVRLSKFIWSSIYCAFGCLDSLWWYILHDHDTLHSYRKIVAIAFKNLVVKNFELSFEYKKAYDNCLPSTTMKYFCLTYSTIRRTFFYYIIQI